MNYKNSHYYRLFRHTMIIICILILILGVFIIGIGSKLFVNARLDDIRNVGTFYAECISEKYDSDDFIKYSDNIRRRITDNLDVKIYLYDNNEKCIVSESDDKMLLDENVKSVIENDTEILKFSSTTLSHEPPYMIYGKKIYITSDKPLYLVIYGGTLNVDSFTIKLTSGYIFLAFLALLSSYLIIRKRTMRHMEFENDFIRIVENYSKGDFSEKLHTDLSVNLQHISERVNSLAANIEKSEEISSTFIANVSHELRTPMTTIGGFVDGILDGTIKKSHQTEYLVLVSQEIQRLRILITSMLNMSKFESGTMSPDFRETNLTDLVIKIVLMFEKRIEEKELNVEELDCSRLTAVVDPDLMQQVIYNLIENAVKFINKGGTLSFSFNKKDGICIIGIRNTGEGLKDEEIPQVFNRFYKTDSSRGKDKTGLGLGLSISRKIVHLHKGHIVVKSVYGEYTEFQIQIPEDPRIVNNDKKEK